MCKKGFKTIVHGILPDPFLQILGELKRCMNEMVKCQGFKIFFPESCVFQDLLKILEGTDNLLLFYSKSEETNSRILAHFYFNQAAVVITPFTFKENLISSNESYLKITQKETY